jgi:hypothetical protein
VHFKREAEPKETVFMPKFVNGGNSVLTKEINRVGFTTLVVRE